MALPITLLASVSKQMTPLIAETRKDTRVEHPGKQFFSAKVDDEDEEDDDDDDEDDDDDDDDFDDEDEDDDE